MYWYSNRKLSISTAWGRGCPLFYWRWGDLYCIWLWNVLYSVLSCFAQWDFRIFFSPQGILILPFSVTRFCVTYTVFLISSYSPTRWCRLIFFRYFCIPFMCITYIQIRHKGVTSAPPVLLMFLSPLVHMSQPCATTGRTLYVILRNLMYGILTVSLLIRSARFAYFAALHVVPQTCNK